VIWLFRDLVLPWKLFYKLKRGRLEASYLLMYELYTCGLTEHPKLCDVFFSCRVLIKFEKLNLVCEMFLTRCPESLCKYCFFSCITLFSWSPPVADLCFPPCRFFEPGNGGIKRRCFSQCSYTSAVSHWTVRCSFQLVHKKTAAVFHSDVPGPRALDSDVKNIRAHFTSDNTLIWWRMLLIQPHWRICSAPVG